MKKLRVAACMLMLALAGCDNNDNAPTAVKKDAPSEVTKAASSENASSAKLSVPERQKLAQQSAGKVLTLLDLSEVQLDGAATLVLTFSIPLDPDQDFSRVIHVVDKKSGKVDGAWELSDNLKELRLRHLEPKRDLIVTIGKEVKALNNAEVDEPRPGLRRGHIPGALNVPWTELVREGELKTTDELDAIFFGRGVSYDKPIIVSCGSGVTAAVVLLALATLDVPNVKLYDGAWSEWGARADLPVEPVK